MKKLFKIPQLSTQRLVALSMVIAVAFILEKFTIRVIPGQLHITFTFIANTVMGAIAGPFWGFISLGLLDLMTIFLSPDSGNFIIWWTLMEAMTGALYGFFFYKKPLNWNSKSDWLYVTGATFVIMLFSVFIMTPLLIQIYFKVPFLAQYISGRWLKIFEWPVRVLVTMLILPKLQTIPSLRKLMGLK